MIAGFRFHEAPRMSDIGEIDREHESSQLPDFPGFCHFGLHVDITPSNLPFFWRGGRGAELPRHLSVDLLYGVFRMWSHVGGAARVDRPLRRGTRCCRSPGNFTFAGPLRTWNS